MAQVVKTLPGVTQGFIYIPHTVNAMAADVLVTQGAIPPGAIVMAYYAIPVSASEGLNSSPLAVK